MFICIAGLLTVGDKNIFIGGKITHVLYALETFEL